MTFSSNVVYFIEGECFNHPISIVKTVHNLYERKVQAKARKNGKAAEMVVDLGIEKSAAERLLVLKTSSKLMSDEFWQFVAFTSGTSLGSANVMSAHCFVGARVSKLVLIPVLGL